MSAATARGRSASMPRHPWPRPAESGLTGPPRRIPCGTSCRPRGRSRSRGARTRDSRGAPPRHSPARAALYGRTRRASSRDSRKRPCEAESSRAGAARSVVTEWGESLHPLGRIAPPTGANLPSWCDICPTRPKFGFGTELACALWHQPSREIGFHKGDSSRSVAPQPPARLVVHFLFPARQKKDRFS